MLFLNIGRYPLEDSVLVAYFAASLGNRFSALRRTFYPHLKRSIDQRRMPRAHYAVSKRRKPMTQRRIMSWKCPILCQASSHQQKVWEHCEWRVITRFARQRTSAPLNIRFLEVVMKSNSGLRHWWRIRWCPHIVWMKVKTLPIRRQWNETTLHGESHLSHIDKSGSCALDTQTVTRSFLCPEISHLIGVKHL